MNAASPQPAAQKQPDSRRAWLVLAVLLLFSIAAPLNQFKVPPILPILMDAFRLSLQQSGLLMSVFSITGFILALPAGLILQKMGQRMTGLIAGLSLAGGALLGVLSADMTSLLTSRVIEGIGTSFMAVLAPAIIAAWFHERRRGAAMGIWAAWVPIGSSSMMILAPLLTHSLGWQSVWWIGIIFTILSAALFLLFVKPIAPSDPTSLSNAAPAASQVLRNPNTWLISLAFACFTMAGTTAMTFSPTFLNLERNLPLSQASLIVSVSSILSIISCPLGGMLSDRLGVRRPLIVIGLIIMAGIMPLIAIIPAKYVLIQFILQGLLVGLVPTNIMSAAVETAGDTRLSGMAMAVVMLGQNAGMLLGPILFGAAVESGGWLMAYLGLAPVYLIGAFLIWKARVK